MTVFVFLLQLNFNFNILKLNWYKSKLTCFVRVLDVSINSHVRCCRPDSYTHFIIIFFNTKVLTMIILKVNDKGIANA